MKGFLKTKRMRRLIKQYRMNEVNRMKKDGVWHWRKLEPKLCSECDPLNYICLANDRGIELINLYASINSLHTST